jgi:hypothetical protein
MTRKIATLWRTNPSKNTDAVTYSSASVTYSSATTRYSSSTATLDDLNRLATAWTKPSKSVSAWNANPLAITNLYAYDSATKTYDSASDTYDGVVSGQDFGDQETATAWTEA